MTPLSTSEQHRTGGRTGPEPVRQGRVVAHHALIDAWEAAEDAARFAYNRGNRKAEAKADEAIEAIKHALEALGFAYVRPRE